MAKVLDYTGDGRDYVSAEQLDSVLVGVIETMAEVQAKNLAKVNSRIAMLERELEQERRLRLGMKR